MAGESQAYLSGRLQNRQKMYRFFSYYGGKHGLIGKYPPPIHDTIVEPFAGSAAYATMYGKTRRVFLFDIDPIICGVWQFLIRSTESDILALPIVNRWDDEAMQPHCEEARWLIGFWLAMGQAKPFNVQTSYAATRARSSWSEEIRFKLSRQVKYIKHWRIFNHSYQSVDGFVNGPATYFVDPPYQQDAGSKYTFGNAGINYGHLGQWCRTSPGQVIVCEAGEPDWLPFEFFAHGRTGAGQRTGTARNREVIYYQVDGRQQSWRAA